MFALIKCRKFVDFTGVFAFSDEIFPTIYITLRAKKCKSSKLPYPPLQKSLKSPLVGGSFEMKHKYKQLNSRTLLLSAFQLAFVLRHRPIKVRKTSNSIAACVSVHCRSSMKAYLSLSTLLNLNYSTGIVSAQPSVTFCLVVIVEMENTS